MQPIEIMLTNARHIATALDIFAQDKGEHMSADQAYKAWGLDIEAPTCSIFCNDDMLAVQTADRIEIFPTDDVNGGISIDPATGATHLI